MADAVVSVAITGDASGLTAAVRQAEGALSGLQSSSGAAGGAAERSAKKAGVAWKSVGEGIDQVTKPIQIVSAATAAAGVASAKFAIDFEDNFANVKKTVEGTPEQLAAIKKGIIDLTTTGINGKGAIPQSTAQLTELAAAGGQLGIATDNIVDFTEVMAQMGTATNLVGAEGASTLARFMNVTNTSQDKVRNLGSAIVDLGNNFATTEAEIAALSLRMGETGGVVGISAKDILGYATALSSMGIEAEAGGSAVSRIWMTMQKAVSAGGDDLAAFAKVSGKTSDEFKKQWKEDASGAFQSFIKGLSEAEDQISLLDELGFGNIRDIAALQALASKKGIDLMTDALKRSNTAWEENNALQKEADAKAQTTAGQMAIAKNNVVEAARSMGEVMLPTIVDVTNGVKGFAQGLNKMNDSQKKAVVTGAAAVVGMGALAKGTASTLKTVGNLKEGLGKLGVAVPSISKIGPAIAGAITSPAGIATTAVVALGAAGVIAYKEWDKHQNRWADDMKKSSEKLLESAERYKNIADYSKEIRKLKDVIKNPKSSSEDIEQAKFRIKEIADLLNREYNLKINVEDDGLDEAVEKVEQAVKTLSFSERNTTRDDYTKYFSDMLKASEKFREAQAELKTLQSKYDAAAGKQRLTGGFRSDVVTQNALYKNSGDVKSYIEGVRGIAKRVLDSGLKKEMTDAKDSGRNGKQLWDGDINSIKDIQSIKDFEQAVMQVAGAANLVFTQAETQLNSAKTNTEEFETAAKNAGDALSKMLASDTVLSDSEGVEESIGKFRQLGEQLKANGADTTDLAKSFAAAKQGFTEFGEAVAGGSASQMARDFIEYKKSIDDFAGSENEVIATAAAMKNGFSDIEAASHASSEGINAVIGDMKKLGDENGMFKGMDSSQIADQLTEMAQAMNLIPDTKEVKFNVDTGGFEVVDEVVQSLTQLEGKAISIPITVDGNTEKLSLTAEQVNELKEMGITSLKVNAEGDISLLNDAGEAIGKISKKDVVKIGVETEPTTKAGNFFDMIKDSLGGTTAHAADIETTVNTTVVAGEINSEGFMSAVESAVNGGDTDTQKSVDVTVNYVPGDMPQTEIPAAEAVVNYTGNYDGVEPPPEKDGTAKYTGDFSNVKDAPDKNGSAEYKGDFSSIGTAPTLRGTIVYTKKVIEEATGTNYFPGGLAMVNDQKGISDPRELIIDRGRAFIPRGKDVILPLSRGAKVYTAAQTKAIMRGMGIPHYAKGKENSEAFTNASDDWTHYINTHAVSVTQELEKWVELSKKFKSNAKDVADIEEKIYSLTRKQNDELNEASKEYIDQMSEFNIWDENGDDPLAAYQRVWDRNFAEVQAQRMTWDEFTDTMSDAGSTMYQNRVKQSKEWLEHEKKYHGLSNEDYIAGIKSIEAYTQDYYDRGIIGYAEYRRNMSELDDMYLDNYIDNFDRWLDNAEDNIGKQKQYYGINAKEALAMYDEMIAGADEWLSHLEMSAEKREEIKKKLLYGRMDAQHELYTDYQKGADNYYRIRETFADWDDVGDSKTRYWTGYLANIEKMYRDHNIGWQEYMDESMDKYLKLYEAFGEEYDEKLQKYKDDISEVSTKYADMRKSLQDEWSQDDRKEDFDEVNKLISYYKNAATEAGQEKYKELLDRKKQLERDQQLADLETEEADKIAALQSSYDAMEKEKKKVLADLRTDSVNIFGKVKDMNIDTSEIKELANAAASTIISEAGMLTSSLDSFTRAINSMADKLGSSRVSKNVYNNHGTYHIASDEAAREMIKELTGTVVSGLGGVMLR